MNCLVATSTQEDSWRHCRSQSFDRDVTPACRGRVGVGPLEEETRQEVESLSKYELDSFKNQLEPSCQADMLPVMFMDKDDPNAGMPWVSSGSG